MSGKKLITVILLILAGIALCVVLAVMAIIGVVFFSDGCIYRYSYNPDAQNEGGLLGFDDPEDLLNDIVESAGVSGATSTTTKTAILKASGNYTSSSSTLNGDVIDPSDYGKWLNTGVAVMNGQRLTLRFEGEVSLCRAYLPKNNLQSANNTDSEGKAIPIPRVSESNLAPVYIILDAKNNKWGNIAEVHKGDHVVVTLSGDQKTTTGTTVMYDVFNKNTITTDCREGKTSYHPICGRYVSWNKDDKYVDKCDFIPECYDCNIREECSVEIIGGVCSGVMETVADKCSCFRNHYGTAPEPYLNNGKHTYPWSDNINDLYRNFDRDCESEQEYIDGAYQDERYFWYSANNAAGLVYRLDSSENPSGETSLGGNYAFVPKPTISSGAGNVVFDRIEDQYDKIYLQYRLYTQEGNNVVNSGGYALGVKQTKCRRTRGEAISDDFANRGAIEYAIAPSSSTVNDSQAQSLTLQNGEGQVTANTEGTLWLRIKNKPEDYKDSFGQYNVQIISTVDVGDFASDILTPFLNEFKTMIFGAAERIFQNMTCFNNPDAQTDCRNFFNYIKGMLSLYIMSYGLLFLMGMVQISQTDLVVRVIKVGVVAGLMSGRTFDFFRDYIFLVVINFSDEIIANMAGYSLFSDENSFANPLSFMAEVLTTILLKPTFSAQMMALLSLGLGGVLYFIIMVVAVGIVLIVLFRSITIYLMAFMALTVLMGLAPLFLTFILFERTKYLFDNWVKYCFRYMLEPIVLMAGVIILTQLITIFLDNILNYSICWKCVLPFRLPFTSLVGVMPAFLKSDIFCINWFAPWGLDPRNSVLGINLQYIAILLILAYSLWGWADFSAQLVARITGSFGSPSATSMGSRVSNAFESAGLHAASLDKKSRGQMSSAFGKVAETWQVDKMASRGVKNIKNRQKLSAAQEYREQQERRASGEDHAPRKSAKEEYKEQQERRASGEDHAPRKSAKEEYKEQQKRRAEGEDN